MQTYLQINIFNDIKEIYSKSFNHLDTSLIDEYHSVEDLYINDLDEDIKSKIRLDSNNNSNALEVVIEEVKNKYPERVELLSNVHRRVGHVVDYVKRYRYCSVISVLFQIAQFGVKRDL